MKKIGKKVVLSVLSLSLSIVLLFGMITATILLQQDNRKDWEYYTATQSIDYYGDSSAYGFQCVYAFKKSLITYFSTQETIQAFIGSNAAIEKFVQRIVEAMSDARISPSKLEKTAQVLTDNSLPTLINRYISVLEKYGTFENWLEDATNTISQTDAFSLACEFITSFLQLTSFSEDELASFIYCYLSLYGSEEYKVYLSLYGEQFFTSLLSDTFFAMRTLQKSGSDAMSFSTSSLRSALYELGNLYITVSSFSEKGSVEKLLGFPENFPEAISRENSSLINEYYSACFGSLSDLLVVIGSVMQSLSRLSLEYYLDSQQYEKREGENIDALREKYITGQATDEEINSLTEKLTEKNAKKILSAQTISKDILAGFNQAIRLLRLSYENNTEIVEHFYNVSYMLREIIYSLSSENEKEEQTLELLNTYNENFQSALNYFADKEYTYEDIIAMDTSLDEYAELVGQAENISAISGMLSLYVNSEFSLWLTYSLYARGLISYE